LLISLCRLAWQLQAPPLGNKASPSAASASEIPFPPLRPLDLFGLLETDTPVFVSAPAATHPSKKRGKKTLKKQRKHKTPQGEVKALKYKDVRSTESYNIKVTEL